MQRVDKADEARQELADMLLERQYRQALDALSDQDRAWVEEFVGGTTVSFPFDAQAYLDDEATFHEP